MSSFLDRLTSSERPLEMLEEVPPLLAAMISEIALDNTKIAYLCSALVRCM